MKRWVIAVMGLMVVGCAVGVEDPQPAPAPEPVQKDPPAQTFSGDLLENPYDSIAQRGVTTDIPNLPPRQKPPVPGLQVSPVEVQD